MDEKTKEFCGISSKAQKKKRRNYLNLCISTLLDLLQGEKKKREMKKDLSSDGELYGEEKVSLSEKSTL